MFKRIAAIVFSILLTALSNVSPVSAQTTKLYIYTALEKDQLAIYKAAIEKAVPAADVQWVQGSTGVITARLLAEKPAPKADMIFGLAASSIMLFKREDMLERYQAAGVDKHNSRFRSADGSFVGMDAFLAVLCYNTVEGVKAGTTVPTSYKDLLDPKFKGKIVMPNPVSSGTGYMMVAAWLQTMGETKGWKFMDALHENIANYAHSGSSPCVQAAKGERLVGLSFDMRGAKEKTGGAPIEVILPSEGVGWEMEAIALVKKSPNLALAKKVADWAASKAANQLYANYYAIVAHPEVKPVVPNYPLNAEARMAKINFVRMALDRDRILAEWSKRYDSKTAPRS
jgi:iron(III) transport system substrate-binding protein